MKKSLLIFSLSLSLVGCAELSSLNNAVGEAAGKLNSVLGSDSSSQSSSGNGLLMMHTKTVSYAHTIDHSSVVKGDIDTLYVKIKREFNFQTREEALGNASGKQRNWVAAILEENGFIHEATPGVYYHMANSFGDGNVFDVTLEKDSGKVRVSWMTKSDDSSFASKMKNRLLKAIK